MQVDPGTVNRREKESLVESCIKEVSLPKGRKFVIKLTFSIYIYPCESTNKT